MKTRSIILALLILIVVSSLSGCDVGELWARFDWCGERTTRETATGNCRVWWDLADGVVTEEEVNAQIESRLTTPTPAPTPIPPPPHRPVQVILPTETPVTGYSPLPTPTTTPIGGDWVPDTDDYEGLLDWYFKR